MKKHLCILLLASNFVISLTIHAQRVTQLSIDQDSAKYTTTAFRAITFELDTAFNDKTFLHTAEKTYTILPDEHVPITHGKIKSKLIVFDAPQHSFSIETTDPEQIKIAYLIYTPDIKTETKLKNQPHDSCSQPPMIMQEVWRAGLPDPDYERIPNTVHNQIIHHSATDNELTDYVNLIRSIYIYHTEVNGWSDIGYNYLISPDGLLFAGRDPGDNLAQDDVLGAHFCAANTGTMGICMLGTFIKQTPTPEALSTLNHLVSWKAIWSNLDPQGTYSHPLNPNLPTIAGHQDGCATSCPGDSLVKLLPQIRALSLETLYNCGVFPGLRTINNSSLLKISPNPTNSATINYSSSLQLSSAALFDLFGNQLVVWQSLSPEKSLHLPATIKEGLYMIRFITITGNVITQKILVID